ncbi:MAG: TrmH family RNA methyltransferase [Burkholderiales bacterium]
MRNPEVASLFEQCRADRRYIFSDRVFERVSPVESPVGLLAIIAIPTAASPRKPWTDGVLLDAIQDAGNVGSILRITAAAGVRCVATAKGSADLWSPKVLRAGMGAHFSLDLHSHDELTEIATRAAGAVIVGASDANQSLYDVDLRGPVVWTFGAEGQGVSAAMRALATMEVRIPMAVGSESLNVAAAAAICLFEQARQRRG